MAEWDIKDSGGRLFIDKCLADNDELVLIFEKIHYIEKRQNITGSAEIGMMKVDPRNITQTLNINE